MNKDITIKGILICLMWGILSWCVLFTILTLLSTEKEEVIVYDIPENNSEVLSKLDALSNQLTLKSTECNSKYYVDSCRGSFESILGHISELRPYELGYWDCEQFSSELVRNLRIAGYFSVKEHNVQVDCNLPQWNSDACTQSRGLHQIVKVYEPIYIEATSGRIIMPFEYDAWGIK